MSLTDLQEWTVHNLTTSLQQISQESPSTILSTHTALILGKDLQLPL